MAETFIEAALNGKDGSQEAHFFLADHFVTYKWDSAPDRVVDGVRSVSEWGIPASFTPPPSPDTSVEPSGLDAAVKGRAGFLNKAYFFKRAQYMRSIFDPRGPDTTVPLSLSAWHLLGAAFTSGIDAAFNGRFSRDGKGYFFRGNKYNRYDWVADAPDKVDPSGVPYPRSVSNMVGMPPRFASGVSAAVDGDGPFGNVGYLFREDQYLRFNWKPPGGGEPRVDGASAPIHRNWLGLVELLLAGKAKAKALVWIQAARDRLNDFVAGALTGNALTLLNAALQIHFHIDPALPQPAKLPFVNRIRATYDSVVTTLNGSATRFRFRTAAEANSDLTGGSGFPAYTFFGKTMNFTEHFAERRRLQRAAIVLHEGVHVTDSQSANRSPSGALLIDIPEWYVTDPEATRLGLPTQANRSDLAVRYNNMTTSDAVHNPSAYAAFAQHVAIGSDTRFGDGKSGPE
ncbi:MAG TPA: hypothetical protein VH643_06095 [Gemmataceae bacterium]|jgi:hypothetical protein